MEQEIENFETLIPDESHKQSHPSLLSPLEIALQIVGA